MKPDKGFEARNGWNATVGSSPSSPSYRRCGPEGHAQLAIATQNEAGPANLGRACRGRKFGGGKAGGRPLSRPLLIPHQIPHLCVAERGAP